MITLETLATYEDKGPVGALLANPLRWSLIQEMAWKYSPEPFLVEAKLPSGEMRNFSVCLYRSTAKHTGDLLVQDTQTHERFTFLSEMPEWRKLL